MIYASSGAGGSAASRRVVKGSSAVERKGIARRGSGKGGGGGGGGNPQQVVQWKQKNVEEGIVVVDEQQLSKLIKREPIEKYYKLDPEPFASGLFASVRRCVSLDTGEVYAAKFSSRARYGEDCSAEIHHEIALLSLCAPSPRIVTLHDVFETPTEVIILMQYAPGGDLQTVIDENQVPFETDVVNFIRQLVEGLAYLHERKIAHLDIKPQNLVMMGDFPNCDIKLCDFEISRVILEGAEIREILGTPDYVAPEILHYEPITLAADMWSLGVTTYVLLTGFSPFGGETDQETFCNISRAQLDFPDELFEDISQEAKDFVQQLLVRDPRARPTAKNLLHHRWLASQKAPRRRIGSTDNMKVSVSDTNGKSHTMSEKNLRKYLSKSREALFERVIQQQTQYKNDLRKTTLLSQCNKTRMCESHMSLVSKTREERPLISLSPSFSRSREKLYGLRSLSRSHEGLDVIKVSSGQRAEGQGNAKAYTRATTADLSMLPLLRLKERLDEGVAAGEDEIPPVACDACPTSDDVSANGTARPKEKIFRKNNSDSCITISSLVSPTLLKNTLVNCAMLVNTASSSTTDATDTSTPDKPNEQNSPLTTHNCNTNDSYSKFEETLVTNTSSTILQNNDNKMKISPNTPIIPNGVKEESSECIDKVKDEEKNLELPLENKERLMDETTEQENTTATNSTTEVQETNSTSNTTEKEEPTKADEETENEPTFTVAQLISAYNRHQEIVTRTSLEVTMTSSDKMKKLPPPYIADNSTDKFPTGPTALRLFIPDIDIETTIKKKNRTKSYRTLSKSSIETKNLDDSDNASVNGACDSHKKEVNSGSDTAQNLDQANNNMDAGVCSFVLNPPAEEKHENDADSKQPLVDRNTNYLRSASLSSETSSLLTPSETLSSLSWEEVNVMPRANGDDTHWLNQRNASHKSTGNRIMATEGANPWGRLCTGSYTRAMEKFGGKNEPVTETATVTATRKCSLSMLFPEKQDIDEKVRRKSTSVIKLS